MRHLWVFKRFTKGRRDGSVSKVLTMQAPGPRFNSPEFMLKQNNCTEKQIKPGSYNPVLWRQRQQDPLGAAAQPVQLSSWVLDSVKDPAGKKHGREWLRKTADVDLWFPTCICTHVNVHICAHTRTQVCTRVDTHTKKAYKSRGLYMHTCVHARPRWQPSSWVLGILLASENKRECPTIINYSQL